MEERDFQWDEQAQTPRQHPRLVELPFVQWGITGVILGGSGFPTAGTPFGRIRVDRDAITVRGFLWRTRRFPRASTQVYPARGIMTRGIRLRSDQVGNEVVFFPHSDIGSLNTALKVAGFMSKSD